MSESLSLIVRTPESMQSPIGAMLPPVLERLGLSQIVSVMSQEGPSVLLSLPDLDERWEPKASDLTEDALEDWLSNAYWGGRGCC